MESVIEPGSFAEQSAQHVRSEEQMSMSAGKIQPLAVEAYCRDDALRAALADGRAVSVPLDWSPRLEGATPEERKHWRLTGGGLGIRWEAIDADVSVENLLRLR